MKHKINYVENDAELNEEIEPEYDFSADKIDWVQTWRMRALAARAQIETLEARMNALEARLDRIEGGAAK